MAAQKIQYLLQQIKQLSPFEKGELFSLFLLQEKKDSMFDRKSLFGSVKVSSELSDSDIRSCHFNIDSDDLLS